MKNNIKTIHQTLITCGRWIDNRWTTYNRLSIMRLLPSLIIFACSGRAETFVNVCYSGNVEQVRELVKDVNLNAVDIHGRTGIMMAALAGRSETVELLLSKGAKVDVVDMHGLMPLDYACAGGHVEIARKLVSVHLETGGDIAKDMMLIPLAQQGCTELLSEIIALGANVNVKSNKGWTPLLTAIWRGHYETCELLLEAGADPNISSSDKDTTCPIIVAAVAGNARIVSLLVESNANMSVRDSDDVTALMRAVWLHNNDVVSTLLDLGDDPNVVYEDVPLVFIAAEVDNWKAVDLLKKYGAKARMKYQGSTVSLADYLKIKMESEGDRGE